MLMHHWNTNDIQMIETIRTIEMIEMKMNDDASLQVEDALWCGVDVDVDVASMEPNDVVCGGGVGDAVDVASMEPNRVSMSGGGVYDGAFELMRNKLKVVQLI